MERLLEGEVYHYHHKMICCYNAARNDPYKDSRHPRYQSLEKWPDRRIKEVGQSQWDGLRRRSDDNLLHGRKAADRTS